MCGRPGWTDPVLTILRAQSESIKELCRTCLSTERASRGFFLLRDEKIKKLEQTAGGKISQ